MCEFGGQEGTAAIFVDMNSETFFSHLAEGGDEGGGKKEVKLEHITVQP